MTKDGGSIRKLPSGRYQARRWDTARNRYVSLGTYNTEDDAHRAILRADIIEEAGYVPESPASKDTSSAAGREPFARYAERTLNARREAIHRSTFRKYNKLLQSYLKRPEFVGDS